MQNSSLSFSLYSFFDYVVDMVVMEFSCIMTFIWISGGCELLLLWEVEKHTDCVFLQRWMKVCAGDLRLVIVMEMVVVWWLKVAEGEKWGWWWYGGSVGVCGVLLLCDDMRKMVVDEWRGWWMSWMKVVMCMKVSWLVIECCDL